MPTSKDLLAVLNELLGLNGLLQAEIAQSEAEIAPYLQGARYGAGRTPAVLRPRTVRQAEAALAALHEHAAQFVLQGANTGLVAASTPDDSGQQFVLSLDRLKEPILIDPQERTAVVSAGVRLSELNKAAAEHGLCFPIDLSADPSIGGMIAANTGGARLIKYGDVRANLCAVDAWLAHAPSAALQFGSALRKNNTGIDFKQLLCGTGGALGVILRATLRLHPLPKQRATALVVPASADAVMPLLAALERDLSEFIASVEGMSQPALQATFRHHPTLRNPFANGEIPPYALLVELVTSLPPQQLALDDLLQESLAGMLESELLTDALFGDQETLWRIRHSISEALRNEGQVIAFDICLPRRHWAEFRVWGAHWLAENFPTLQICDFGHVADGGLHYNLVAPKAGPGTLSAETIQTLRTALLDTVVRRFAGSFSAEHGIGPYNRAYYERYTPPEIRRLAGSMKNALMPGLGCGNVRFD